MRPEATPYKQSSSRRRIGRLPCARSSRCCAGVPAVASRRAVPLLPRPLPLPSPVDLYDSATASPDIEACMLGATLREAARRFGEEPAYVTTAGWPISYAELDALSDEVAAGLAHCGLTEGDVLALVLPPGPEYAVAFLAAA